MNAVERKRQIHARIQRAYICILSRIAMPSADAMGTNHNDAAIYCRGTHGTRVAKG